MTGVHKGTKNKLIKTTNILLALKATFWFIQNLFYISLNFHNIFKNYGYYKFCLGYLWLLKSIKEKKEY